MAKSKGFEDQSKKKLLIESVVPLDEKTVKQIVEALGLKPDQVMAVNERNTSLIGGLRISYEGKVIDMSLGSKISKLA